MIGTCFIDPVSRQTLATAKQQPCNNKQHKNLVRSRRPCALQFRALWNDIRHIFIHTKFAIDIKVCIGRTL